MLYNQSTSSTKKPYYKVAEGHSITSLAAQVNQLKKEGYQVTGGICVKAKSGHLNECYYQAMTLA